MKVCTRCGEKSDDFDTVWDKIRKFMFNFFHSDIYDVSAEKYTQGFSEGYKQGYEAHRRDTNQG